MIPLERAYDLNAAQSEIARVICSLGMKYELHTAGERIFAAKCDLLDASGQLLASGLGKGEEQPAIVGAMFEAMEHYITNFRFLKPSNIQYIPSSHFSTTTERALTKLVSSVIHQSHSGFLPCISHDSISDDAEECLFPVGLFVPSYVDEICKSRSVNPQDTYVYSRLGEYSSNTGVAIGMSKTESIVHGLLESSERDALSRFIFYSFLKHEDEYLQKLDMESLPYHLRSLADSVADECSVQGVSIYSMPNRFGIPTYCSWISRSVLGIHQAGFGCSLSETHAIARSLYEVTQGYLSNTKLHQESVIDEFYRKKLINLQSYPPLLKCLKFDIARMEELHGYRTVKYQGIERHSSAGLEQYLHQILSKIRGGGSSAHSVEFELPIDTKIKVTHSIIGDSDRFMTVLGGRIPMPGAIQHGGLENGTIRA